MLLFLLAMGILFGGAEDAWDTDDMVLAVSAATDGDLIEEMVGEVMDCVVTYGDLSDRTGCIGI